MLTLKLRWWKRAVPALPWEPTRAQRRHAAAAAEGGLTRLIGWIEQDADADARCRRRTAARDIVFSGSHLHTIGLLQECVHCQAECELDSLTRCEAMQAETDRLVGLGVPNIEAINLSWRQYPARVCEPCHGLGYVPADELAAVKAAMRVRANEVLSDLGPGPGGTQ
jgi:hypothetical protein